jgi:hypothetical protein
MHIVDYGYDRDLQRLDVAVRFIRHEARTRTIRQWTGLSDDRIRKLYHSYLRAGGSTVRHRGQSPRQATYFLRSSRMRAEASTLASLCCLVGLFDSDAFSPCRQRATDVERAAALCVAYERYRATVHDPAITFEHAVLLVTALARGNELRLGDCRDCGALQVVDWLELRPTRCGLCSAGLARGPADFARSAAAVPTNSATPNT